MMFKDQDGKLSMMRVGFFVALLIGSIVALSGTVAMFLGLDAASTAMTTGLAVMGSSGFAKAIQCNAEKKQNDKA